MDEILHTLQKLFSYAYINSYQSLKKVCTPFPPYRKNGGISSWLISQKQRKIRSPYWSI